MVQVFNADNTPEIANLPITAHAISILNEANSYAVEDIQAVVVRAVVASTAMLEIKLAKLYEALGAQEIDIDEQLRRLLSTDD